MVASQASPSLDLSVLLLCRNEAGSIAACVAEARAALEACSVSGEVLVVDNLSEDGSAALAAQAGARVVSVAEIGYGGAVLGGLRALRSEYAVLSDGDGEWPVAPALPAFVEQLRSGADLVVGYRTSSPRPWWNAHFGQPLLSACNRFLHRVPVRDSECGIRAFRVPALLNLPLCETGFAAATEMIVRAHRARLALAEVPVPMRSALDPARRPHLRPWLDGLRMLSFSLRLLFSTRK